MVVATVTALSTHPSLGASNVNFLIRVSQQICWARTISTPTTTLCVIKSIACGYSCTGLDRLPRFLDNRQRRWLSCRPQKISLALFPVRG
jgi:hypothetical protein